jgi:hypothetical protein
VIASSKRCRLAEAFHVDASAAVDARAVKASPDSVEGIFIIDVQKQGSVHPA